MVTEESGNSQEHIGFWAEDPRVRAIVETVADAVIGIDREGLIEFFNPAAERLFGYTETEVIGCNVRCLAAPEHQPHHDDYIRHYLETGEARIIGKGREVRGQRRDGSLFPLYLSVGEFNYGGIQGFVGIAHDLTELKDTREELDEARSLMQNIIDSMPSMLVGVDAKGCVTHWNQPARDATGMSADEAIGRAFDECFPHLAAQKANIGRAIEERRPVGAERVTVPAKGDLKYMEVMVYPLVANGTKGAAVRIDDVTERVRIEEMMIQTEKMLSVGGLAAGMAHEINNPLGIIAQGCQNLKRRLSAELPANQRLANELGLDLELLEAYMEKRGIYRFLEGMSEGVARSTRIIGDMLTYSRRSASSFEPTDLRELLEATLRLAGHDYDLKKNYDFRHIRIERDYQLLSDPVLCDRTALEQVLLNLIKNAAQAMSAVRTEAPCLRLALRQLGNLVRIEVADNGPGMDSSVRKRVFEPFFTTKPVGEGTGLGLSVAYFIITEQHQGRLWVETAAKEGCVFVLELPSQVAGGDDD